MARTTGTALSLSNTEGAGSKPWNRGDSGANIALELGQTSAGLIVTLSGTAVPDGATVDGITASFFAAGTASLVIVQLYSDGDVVGDNQIVSQVELAGEGAIYTYGSASSKWGLTPTPAEANALQLVIYCIGEGTASVNKSSITE